MANLQFYLLALFVAYAKSSYVFSNKISFEGGKYNVSYNFNASSDILEFLVEVQATGWVGFGFGSNAPNNMMDYDVAVGGVSNDGSSYLHDYFTMGRSRPPLDSQQDWNLTNATEHNGVTTLKFFRQRDTGDAANDTAIEPGTPIFLIWAYHTTSDAMPESFQQHSVRGYSQQAVTLIPAATTTATPSQSVSMTTTDAASAYTTAETGASTMHATTTSALEALTTSTPAAISPSASEMQAMTTIASELLSSLTPPAISTSTVSAMDPVTTSSVTSTTTASIAAASASMVASATATPFHFSNFVSLDDGTYNISWAFNGSTDTIHFTVEVRATGWIGFGVATQAPTGMVGYDVAVGGVLSGSSYLKDYFTSGFGMPPEDSQQDWMTISAKEERGVTTLSFYRKRDTNDQQKDIAIQQGQSYYFIWAYHLTDDVRPGQFPKHSRTGNQLAEIIPNVQPATTRPMPTATTAATMAPTTEMPVFTISFDNDRFLVLWRFDSQADKMFYHVKVKTIGWIGFGFAETAPNNMVNYDVIIGGFNNGQGYLSDYKTFGRRRPTLDANQNYTLLDASEVGGYTELKFERPRDTNDSNDLAFGRGSEVFLIWAYSNADITNANSFGIHSTRGWSTDKVVMVPADQPLPTEAKASSLHAGICVALSTALLNILFL